MTVKNPEEYNKNAELYRRQREEEEKYYQRQFNTNWGDPYLALKKKILNRYELHDFLSNNEIKYSMDLPSVFGYPPCLETFRRNGKMHFLDINSRKCIWYHFYITIYITSYSRFPLNSTTRWFFLHRVLRLLLSYKN